MKGIRLVILLHSSFKFITALAFALSLAGVARSQEVVQASENVAESNARTAQPAPEADAAQRRIARARALAASGKRGIAAGELEALYTSTKDESVRDVSRILLMWIYVELPDYGRAAQLLEQTYGNRAAAGDEGTRDFYALAGQVLGGARAHAERYRTFGLRPDDTELPAEAKADLDQMRALVERVLEQAKGVREETSRARDRGGEATALVEEAANVRLRLARDDSERERWQREVADARQRLFNPDARIAKVSDSVPPAADVQTQGATQSTSMTAAPPSDANTRPATSAPQTPSANSSAANVSAATGGEAKKPEAAPKGEGGTVAVGALHSIARQKVSPSYPQIARTARITGLVTVYLVVNEKGEVERVQRADGPIQLQSAASEAARRWKFHPTVVDGQPVKVSGYINFNFAL